MNDDTADSETESTDGDRARWTDYRNVSDGGER